MNCLQHEVSHDSLSNVIGHDCEIMFIYDVQFSSILNEIHQNAFYFHLSNILKLQSMSVWVGQGGQTFSVTGHYLLAVIFLAIIF
jgi:hypothetical protein